MWTLSSRVTLVAPAKVNLYLGVGARRPDGYHDVDTVLQAISLADIVTIEPADALRVTCEPDVGVPAEENLAYRAAVAWGATFGHAPDVHIAISKRIPAGGGLGGASSDAAAVLVGLCHLSMLFDTDRSGTMVRLAAVAGSLGSDVPFFLEGGTALFGGRGDVLARRLATPGLHLALVNPGQPVSTGAAYVAFDRMLQAPPPGPGQVISACEDDDAGLLAGALYNNMTDSSAGLVPSVGEVLSWCRARAGVMGAAVAGSGSTIFAVCEGAAAAFAVAQHAESRGWWSSTATTIVDGARILESGEG